MPTVTATCVHCGADLRLWVCGCYIDRHLSRRCSDGRLHEPEFGTQPERCRHNEESA